MRLLVADDDAVTREVVTYAFTRAGHAVFQAPDGDTALALLEREEIDAAFIDFVMPGCDGVTVARAHRAREHGARAILILLTGAELSEGTEEASYFDAVLNKPAAPRTLLRTLAMLTGVRYPEPRTVAESTPSRSSPSPAPAVSSVRVPSR